MILIKLFVMFFKIALFNFGGGYAMIPLIAKDLEVTGWLSSEEFINIIAISQMTPGAIAINTATFVGYLIQNIPGAIVTTVAVPLPSLIIIILLYPILDKHKNHEIVKKIFYGIRPVVAGLIIAAVYFVAQTALLNKGFENISIIELLKKPLESINFGSLAIIVIGYILLTKTKVSPMLMIVFSSVAGIIIFGTLS